MVEMVVSSSSNRDDTEINKCHDKSNSSEGSSSSESSSKSSYLDEVYSSRTPRTPLEVFQERMRKRVASGSSTGLSIAPPAPTPSLFSQQRFSLLCFEQTILHRHGKTS